MLLRSSGQSPPTIWVPFFSYALVWEAGFAVLAAAALRGAGPAQD